MKMKKAQLLTLIMLVGMAAGAQKEDFQKHRIIAGFSTVNGISNSLKSLGDDPGFSTNFMIGYHYRFDEKWSAGGNVYLGIIGINGINNNPFPSYDAAVGYMSIMAKNHYRWKEFKNETISTRLYSGVGIGFYSLSVTLTDYSGLNESEVETTSGYSYQVDLIGAETAWKHFGVWSVLGFGYEGILKVGASVNW